MKTGHQRLTAHGVQRQMRNILCFLMLGAWFCAGPADASAETPWSRLARVISPNAAPPPAAAEQNAANEELREVPDEVGGAGTMTQVQLASLQPDAKTGMTGLAVTGPGAGAGQIDFGRESDDSEEIFAMNLFKNPEIRRLLGDEPRYIYDPVNRPDPMLVPWVRRAVIYEELSAQAASLLAAEQFDEALEVYERILEMNDPRFNVVVRAKLAEIAAQQRADAQAVVQAMVVEPEEKIELPPWVKTNTMGVIVSPGNSLCMVGTYLLREGDQLDNYPGVMVQEIAPNRVTYRIKDKTFVVELTDGF